MMNFFLPIPTDYTFGGLFGHRFSRKHLDKLIFYQKTSIFKCDLLLTAESN